MSIRDARRPRVALATYTGEPLLYGEEQELVPRLLATGVEAEAAVWNDAGVDWSRFDAIVIRSVWDYFEHYAAFCAWLDRVERTTRVYNSPSLVRWNSDKLYLRDLERQGVRILPTVFCERGRPADLASILAGERWEEAVIKPCVSGGAHRTHRVRLGSGAHEKQAEVDAILATTGVLVQPFFPEIQVEGEWSFVFFDGALSHTILKRPAGGDYRVQTLFGGTFAEEVPDPALVEQARAVMRALPEPPAYARIDGVRRERDFYLMEAELIEPYLNMSASPGALERCVRMIERLVRPG